MTSIKPDEERTRVQQPKYKYAIGWIIAVTWTGVVVIASTIARIVSRAKR